MRPLSRRLFKLINGDTFQPIELLDVSLAGSTDASIIRLTSAGESVTWFGHTYQPFHFGRGQVDDRMVATSGQMPSVTITVTNVDTQMAGLLSHVELEGATATLRLTDRRIMSSLRNSDVLTITSGEVRDAAISDSNLTFQIVGVVGQMERITIPLRVFQSNCNYVFGSTACGASASAFPNSIQDIVVSGTTKHVDVPIAVYTAAGSPADPSDYWSNGYVTYITGGMALLSRPIQRAEVTGGNLRFWFRTSFPTSPIGGDGILIKRNCRRTITDCQAYQGNILQYGGFPNVPPERFTPTYQFNHADEMV